MTEQAMREAFDNWCLETQILLDLDEQEAWNIFYEAWQAALQWAAEGQEPVAWKWVPSEAWGEPVVTFDKDKAKEAMSFDMTVEPLYAAPVPNVDLLAEVERLRTALAQLMTMDDSHLYQGDCPYKGDATARDPECPACQVLMKIDAALAKGE